MKVIVCVIIGIVVYGFCVIVDISIILVFFLMYFIIDVIILIKSDFF